MKKNKKEEGLSVIGKTIMSFIKPTKLKIFIFLIIFAILPVPPFWGHANWIFIPFSAVFLFIINLIGLGSIIFTSRIYSGTILPIVYSLLLYPAISYLLTCLLFFISSRVRRIIKK